MLSYIRVQFEDQTRISEYAMSDRNEVYNLVNMLEQNNMVKAYQIYCEGKRIESYHRDYGFSNTISANKFTMEDFVW